MMTVPGFTLQSKKFMVSFIAGLRNNQVSKKVAYETDWTHIMVIILRNLEKFPLSTYKVRNFLTENIDSWIRAHERFEPIRCSIEIEEKSYFTKPYGSKKCLTISFTDKFKTKIIFHVKKKSVMKSLRELGAEAVVDNLKTDKNITNLDIPKTLTVDLMQAAKNDWSPTFFRRYICKRKEKDQMENVRMILDSVLALILVLILKFLMKIN